ncbi:MAG: MerR family transcriptional regulator [Chloroflexota bacterium]|nr:MerR family transcriptional regulator [Chloroflexota bacterium]
MTTVIDDAARRFLSIGAVGRLVGLSPTRLRELEAAGVIPKAARLEGMDRRLYSGEDVATIRAALADRATGQQARGAA